MLSCPPQRRTSRAPFSVAYCALRRVDSVLIETQSPLLRVATAYIVSVLSLHIA